MARPTDPDRALRVGGVLRETQSELAAGMTWSPTFSE
jgi:hypothetical protein